MQNQKRTAGGMTEERFQRLANGVTGRRLAAVAGIEPSRLSRAERGLLKLRPEEKAAHRRALEFLSEPEPAAVPA